MTLSTPRPALSWIFFALAVAGTILPMRKFLQWFSENGFDLPGMIDAWNVNPATQGLTWDLTISALALTVWILVDRQRPRGGWLCLPLTYCVGVSCALPLYIGLRLRAARSA